MGVDCKFLNFGVNIAKSLKLHGLKVNFSPKKKKKTHGSWPSTPTSKLILDVSHFYYYYYYLCVFRGLGLYFLLRNNLTLPVDKILGL
jgi:hypothetical protein